MPLQGAELRVRGQVQGVGFRPHVWQLATRLGLSGEVLNDAAGVLIRVNGNRQSIALFEQQLQASPPPLARVDAITVHETPWQAGEGFRIVDSEHGRATSPVTPDAAMCPQCREELFDPSDRRFEYPFLNCTHCGPRLSIITRIPYDRASTSMAVFTLCERCEREYRDPANRRFHAQPTACADCGPTAWLINKGAEHHDRVIEHAAGLIRDGKILAIKGLGGFHLVCDATNTAAIERLRLRKHRPHKPLALMARDIEQVIRHAEVSAAEHRLLNSTAAPIVLLKKRAGCALSASIAPGQREVGFMLAYTPLHALLLAQLDAPIVATSGNRSGLPPCTGNEEAFEQLNEIADAFVLHDRDIINRVDDSVIRVQHERATVLRRARGHAPSPLPLPPGFELAPSVLAVGSELKNTFCLLHNGEAVLSQHIGDLNNLQYLDDYEHNLSLYTHLFQFEPSVIAVDMHPDYLAGGRGRQHAQHQALTLTEVQHHHAHIASCLAENGWPLDAGRVIGIALDGTGYGADQTSWGGEILHAGYDGFERVACLKPMALPGGELAARQPWRNLVAHLVSSYGEQPALWPAPGRRLLQDLPVSSVANMIRTGINCPLSSSSGRLFDAVAAAVGICIDAQSFEGQAAMALEALTSIELCGQQADNAYPMSLSQHDHMTVLDSMPIWQQLFEDIDAGLDQALISARFHFGFASAIADLAETAARDRGASHIALSGGVFQNSLIDQLVTTHVQDHGFHVLRHAQVPCNDGGLALGQAIIAAANAMSKE